MRARLELQHGGVFASSVSGGKENKATGEGSSISGGGGGGGEASSADASVTGGRLGKAPYFASTVLGGLEEVTEAEFASRAMSAAARPRGDTQA